MVSCGIRLTIRQVAQVIKHAVEPVTRESRSPEHGKDTRKLVYNNPNLGECICNIEPVCVQNSEMIVMHRPQS
jgi:hypothetical protein